MNSTSPKLDANKLLDPVRPGTSLKQLAYEINLLVSHESSVQLAVGRRLLAAKALCEKARIKIPFEQWCSMNIRKLDGEPYSWVTITKLMYKAGDEEKFKASEKAKNARAVLQRAVHKIVSPRLPGDQAQRVLDYKRANPSASLREVVENVGVYKSLAHRVLSKNKASVSTEVNLLMTAWEAASEEARRTFLQQIGATVRSVA